MSEKRSNPPVRKVWPAGNIQVPLTAAAAVSAAWTAVVSTVTPSPAAPYAGSMTLIQPCKMAPAAPLGTWKIGVLSGKVTTGAAVTVNGVAVVVGAPPGGDT